MSENYNQVGQALAAVQNANQDIRSEAEAFLRYAETNVPGYFVFLQQIYLNNDYDGSIRVLAAITFKNGLDKYWRKSAKNAISESEKQTIRQNLFSIESCPASVRRQVAASVARIARTDYPVEWPDMFQVFLGEIDKAQASEDLLLAHVETLHQVVKAMSSQRLPKARAKFQEVAPSLMEFVLTYYTTCSPQWMSGNSSFEVLKISDTTLKIARRVVCHGFEAPHKDSTCRQFFSLLASQLITMWSVFDHMMAHKTISSQPFEDLVAKHILHAGKFFLELSSNSMENFSMNHSYVLMPGSMELVGTYWKLSTAAADSTLPDVRRIVIQGLLLMKQCIRLSGTSETHLKLMDDVTRSSIQQSIAMLKQELFSASSLTSILEGLIMKFLVLSEDDLEEWKQEPEEWILSQDATHWQLDLRPCAEKVLVDLFAQYKQILTNPLLSVLESTANQNSGQGLLIKEAMYNALGTVAPDLFENFDFDSFLDRLQYEIQTLSSQSIFCRRVVILISQWIWVKCSKERRPYAFRIVGTLLQAEGSFGLALSAAFATQSLIDTWDWDNEAFEPYAETYITSLTRTLSQAVSFESKSKILSAIGLIFSKINVHNPANVNLVLEELPRQWDMSNEVALLKVAILALLTRLAIHQRLNTAQGFAIAIPLITYSTDDSTPEQVYLIEEALDLWHTILQWAKTPDEHLLGLILTLSQPSMLTGAPDTLGKVLCIIESNILLFQREQAGLSQLQSLLHSMVNMLGDLQKVAFSHFTKVIDVGIQVLGSDCLSDQDFWRLSELSLREGQDPVMTVCVVCLLARLALLDLSRVCRLWLQYSQGDMTSPIIQQMLTTFDNAGHSKRRKLYALALTDLATTQHPIFKDENVLAGLGNIWSDVLAEVQANAGNDRTYWADDSIIIEDFSMQDSSECQRRKEILEQDPICTISLRECIRNGSRFVDISSLGINLESFLS